MTYTLDLTDEEMRRVRAAEARGVSVADFIIATTNVGHLARFAPADLWTNIAP